MADEPRVARLHLVPDEAARAGDPAPTADFGGTATGDDSLDEGGTTADLRLIGRGAAPGPTARFAAVERAGAPSDAPVAGLAPQAADLGLVGLSVPASARVARLGSAGAGRGGDSSRRSHADSISPDGDGDRQENAGGGFGSRTPEGGAEDRPGARSRRSSSGGRERRPPGPKQIDPDADPVAAAKGICLDLLETRARTKHELAYALRRRGVPDEAAATALDRFDEVGLIDDAAFAGQWVRSRQRTRGLARRALAMELRHKGVDDEVAGEALAEVDATAEEERARELVDRKLRTVPAATPEQRTVAARRLVGMLARKGYGGGIAYRVVREALAAHGAEVDELGSEPPED